MATKWYASHSFNPAEDSAVQNIPDPGDYTDLVTDDICLCLVDNVLHVLTYDSTDSTAEAVPNVITPTGNAGNGRWTIKQSYVTHIGGFPTSNLENPPTDSTISFTDGTRTFSIQPTGSDFTFYVNGTQHVSTGDTVVITDVEGLHWIYFDSDGDLKVQAPGGSTGALILTKCIVGYVYWDATNNEGILVGDERHGTTMAPATHYHLHETLGAKWENGLSLANFDIDGSGNDATAAQFDVTDGEIHDEDIEIKIEDGSPQQLVNATIPTFYKLGVGAAWRKLDATANFPVADGTIGDRLDWNDYNGGTWQLQEVTNNQYTLTHYFATNDINTPIIGIMGQAVYANLLQARTGAEVEISSISLAGLPGAEYVPIATVIWQTNDTYSNQVAARLVSTDLGDDYIDWRTSEITGAGSSTVDHESLANLLGGAAGDHYHLTGAQHDTLTDGSDADALHDHDGISENTAARHVESHTITSHSDIVDATGAQVEELTGGGVTELHTHAKNHNYIDNGDFNIWQRQVSFAAIAFSSGLADRWGYVKVGASVHTVTRDTDVPTLLQSDHESNYSLKAAVTTGDASIDANDFTIIAHKIEGYDYANLVGKNVTLSFWVKAYTTGTYCVSFTSGVGDACYIVEYTISSSLTWEKKEVTIPFTEAAGTWDHINGSGIEINFCLACGATYQNTKDQWNATNDFGTSSQVNGVETTDDVFYLSQVKLEEGDLTTPFVQMSFEAEMAKCQRYYEKSYNIGKYPGEAAEFAGATQLNTTNGASTDPLYQMSFFTVRKRAIPTVTLWDPAGTINTVFRGAAGKAAAVTLQGQEGFLGGTTDATSATYMIYQWVAEALL